jgi:hypothetical protein
MAEKSALRLLPGKDALLEYVSGVYKAKTFVERNGLMYKALVDTSSTFITSEWEVVNGDLRDLRVNFIRDRNALTGNTPTTGTTGYHIPIVDNTNVLVLNATADPLVGSNKFARYNYNKTTAKWLLLQVSTGSTSSNVSNYTLLTNRPNIISGITVTAGAGLTGGGSFSGTVPPSTGTITLQHLDTSSQDSLNPSGFTYVQKLKVDTYGHVTGATTSLWIHPDTSSQANITNTGLTYIQSIQVDSVGHLIGMSSGTWIHPDNSTQGSVINTGTTFIQSIQLDSVGHITGINSAVAPASISGVNFNVAGNSGGSIAMPNGGTLQITGGTNINTVSTVHGLNVGLRINMTPAGSNGQVQVNNSGVLGAGSGLLYGSNILTTPSLIISTTSASGNSSNSILVRDTATGVVNEISQSFIRTAIAGSNTQLQYNSNGILGASSNLTFTGNTTLVSGAVAITTTPSVGSSDDVLTWNSTSKKITKITQTSIVTGKLDTSTFNTYSGNTSAIISSLSSTKLNISSFNAYSGVTATNIANRLLTTSFNFYSGLTAAFINTKLAISSFNIYSGNTVNSINSKLATSSFNFYTGTTEPSIYLGKIPFNNYSATTISNINNKLSTSAFNFYSGITATRLSSLESNDVTGATSLGNHTILGTKLGKNLRFKGLAAGTNIVLTPTSTGITINAPTIFITPYAIANSVQFNGSGIFSGSTGLTLTLGLLNAPNSIQLSRNTIGGDRTIAAESSTINNTFRIFNRVGKISISGGTSSTATAASDVTIQAGLNSSTGPSGNLILLGGGASFGSGTGTGGNVSIIGGTNNSASAAAGSVTIQGGGNSSTGQQGTVTIQATTGIGSGGGINIIAGGSSTGPSGNIVINGGLSQNALPGSNINILAGQNNSTGIGGSISLQGGSNGSTNAAGNINIFGGQTNGAGLGGNVYIRGGINGSSLIRGQVIIVGSSSTSISNGVIISGDSATGSGGNVLIQGGINNTASGSIPSSIKLYGVTNSGGNGDIIIRASLNTLGGNPGGNINMSGGTGAANGGRVIIAGGVGTTNGGHLYLTGGTGLANQGGNVNIIGGTSGNVTGIQAGDVNITGGLQVGGGTGPGGNVNITGGLGAGNGGGSVIIKGAISTATIQGGVVDIRGGSSNTSTTSGAVTIRGGDATSSGFPATLYLIGGNSSNTNAGLIQITGGQTSSTTGLGGGVTIRGGDGTATGSKGGTLTIAGGSRQVTSAGANGDVLINGGGQSGFGETTGFGNVYLHNQVELVLSATNGNKVTHIGQASANPTTAPSSGVILYYDGTNFRAWRSGQGASQIIA